VKLLQFNRLLIIPSILVPNPTHGAVSLSTASCFRRNEKRKKNQIIIIQLLWHCRARCTTAVFARPICTYVLSWFSCFPQVQPTLQPPPVARWSLAPRAWPSKTWPTFAWPAYLATLELGTGALTAVATTYSNPDGARWTLRWSDCYQPLTKTVSKRVIVRPVTNYKIDMTWQ